MFIAAIWLWCRSETYTGSTCRENSWTGSVGSNGGRRIS